MAALHLESSLIECTGAGMQGRVSLFIPTCLDKHCLKWQYDPSRGEEDAKEDEIVEDLT